MATSDGKRFSRPEACDLSLRRPSGCRGRGLAGGGRTAQEFSAISKPTSPAAKTRRGAIREGAVFVLRFYFTV